MLGCTLWGKSGYTKFILIWSCLALCIMFIRRCCLAHAINIWILPLWWFFRNMRELGLPVCFLLIFFGLSKCQFQIAFNMKPLQLNLPLHVIISAKKCLIYYKNQYCQKHKGNNTNYYWFIRTFLLIISHFIMIIL